MFQKPMVLVLGAFLSTAVFAKKEEKNVWPSKSAVLECEPATKVYPFKKFILDLAKTESTFSFSFSKAAGGGEDGVMSTKESLQVESIEVIDEDKGKVISMEADLYADFNDWGAVKLLIRTDDDGPAAFVNFYTDGPSILSFYRCEFK